MLAGPVFTREAVTVPRRPKHYIARATYVTALLMLMLTAWLVLAGTQVIRNIGDLARFGTALFQILAPLQLALAIFFSALFTASSVGQEKDRRTFLLLLVTDLSNVELVLGKLLASLLNVLVLIIAALPLFTGMCLLGGVQIAQVADVFAVTVFSALVAGSLGSTIALWREKTFQSLALTVLLLVFWIGLWESASWLAGEWVLAGEKLGTWAIAFSPWRAVMEATRPSFGITSLTTLAERPQTLFLPVALCMAAALNAVAIWRVRLWNPTREIRPIRIDDDEAATIFSEDIHDAVAETDSDRVQAAIRPPVASHNVWNYPVLWHKTQTWAYGRKMLAIRLAYWVLFFFTAAGVWAPSLDSTDSLTRIIVPMFLISLVLINAQAVSSLSTERDGKTLDLLLVTDLSPKEFVFGKLGGVLYNTKEMVLLPLVLCLCMWQRGLVEGENAFFLCGGLIVMDIFVSVLGIHCGLIHENSRAAVATSLGTVFFLFIGIAACMRIMLAFSGSFSYQLAPFLAFMLGGGVGLYVSLGARNASTAILCASFTCPFLTFWAITSYLQQQTLGPFLVTIATYGFATLTMLIPAISEFDLASGRTTEE